VKPTNELQPLTDALLARFGEDDAGLTAAVDLAVLVAMADGHIDDAERAALASSIEGLIGGRVAPHIAKHLVAESRTKSKAVGTAARAREIGKTLAQHGAGEEGLCLAIAIAWVSDGVSPPEKAALDVVAASAGVSAARVEELIREAKPATGA
jgi:tellurite resistance protein